MNTLNINKIAKKVYRISDGKHFIIFENVRTLLARVREFKQGENDQYYNFECPQKRKSFTVFADNKRDAVIGLFNLLKDSCLLKRFNGTVIRMVL